ncbi:hypothetical protein CVT24_009660 [Panaeolus cyanescens]|uniref:Uncharacterized protein n=1 Tax=Panaeolus cyanescens TaxID=181874 RepID=A0A409Y9T7_9AGAR|nr:hypothetical protein CVT24_009660 [Panaeolus cyanescens]
MPEGNSSSGFSFWKMVVGVMLALKLKEKYDEYRGVSQDEDEEQVRLHRSAGHQRDESLSGQGAIALPDDSASSIAPVQAIRQKKKKACCMCCGLDCTLFWKAFAIVLGLSVLWNSFRFVRWMLTPSPTGLEGLPEFGGVGCANAPFIYNGSEVTMRHALSDDSDHAFIITGKGSGTVTIFGGDEDATDVRYDMTVRTNDKKFIDDISFPGPSWHDGSNIPGRLVLETTMFTLLKPELCQRFDIRVTLPPNLRNFTVYSHTITHIQVDESARLLAGDITLAVSNPWHEPEKAAIIKIHDKMISKNIHLMMEGNGFIIGGFAVQDFAKVTTKGVNATANVKITPGILERSSDSEDDTPSPAVVRTEVGSGRADFTVLEGAGAKRPLDIVHHSSSSSSNMYLHYEKSGFSGKISLDSRTYTAYNMQRMSDNPDTFPKKRPDTSIPRWNYYVGDEAGEDRMVVDTANWVGLYF